MGELIKPDWSNIKFPKMPKVDMIQEAINSICSDLIKKRENQILEILKLNGFEFKNRNELEKFAKERCELISFTYNNRKILRVDGHYLCEWDDTQKIINDGNNITIEIGN